MNTDNTFLESMIVEDMSSSYKSDDFNFFADNSDFKVQKESKLADDTAMLDDNDDDGDLSDAILEEYIDTNKYPLESTSDDLLFNSSSDQVEDRFNKNKGIVNTDEDSDDDGDDEFDFDDFDDRAALIASAFNDDVDDIFDESLSPQENQKRMNRRKSSLLLKAASEHTRKSTSEFYDAICTMSTSADISSNSMIAEVPQKQQQALVSNSMYTSSHGRLQHFQGQMDDISSSQLDMLQERYRKTLEQLDKSMKRTEVSRQHFRRLKHEQQQRQQAENERRQQQELRRRHQEQQKILDSKRTLRVNGLLDGTRPTLTSGLAQSRQMLQTYFKHVKPANLEINHNHLGL